VVQHWATGWMIGGSSPGGGWEFSSSPPRPYQVLYLEVKRPEFEADHSPLSSAEVKNAWSYISTPPIRLHGVVLGFEKTTC
jgi:hypothetical protein